MILDANKYRHLMPTIKLICATQERIHRDPRDSASEIAVALAMPVIAAMIFLMEIYGSTPEAETTMAKVIKFYGHTRIKVTDERYIDV